MSQDRHCQHCKAGSTQLGTTVTSIGWRPRPQLPCCRRAGAEAGPEAGPSQGWKTLLQLSQGGELRKRSLLAVQIIFLIHFISRQGFICKYIYIYFNKPNLIIYRRKQATNLDVQRGTYFTVLIVFTSMRRPISHRFHSNVRYINVLVTAEAEHHSIQFQTVANNDVCRQAAAEPSVTLLCGNCGTQ